MPSTDIELANVPSRTASNTATTVPSTPNTVLTPAESRASGQLNVGGNEPPANKEAFDSYPEDAWFSIVLPCFVLFSTTVGGVYSWGVFQDAFVAEGLASSSALAWIGSTQATIQAIAALPISRLVAAYGPRRIALIGSFFASAGPILGSFCTKNIGGLVVTEGLMFGVGQGLIFFAAATLPSSYFLRRRNIATGFTFAGGGVGGAVFSIIASQLLQRMSLAWTLRAVGLIFAILNVPSALALKARAPREPFRAGKKVVDWSLFKDIRFTLLLIGTAIALFPLFVTPFFLPLFGTSIGLSASTSAFILAGAFNLASAVGRMGFGLLADAVLGSLNALVLCLALVGISTLAIWPVATTMGPLIAFAVINGLCAGGMFSLIPGTISSLFGTTQLSVAFSMTLSSWTLGYFLGSPIAGYLLQAYGGPEAGYGAYRPAIFYSGALSLVSAGFVLAVRVFQSRKVFQKV
ncbi:hypothetical protein JCM6882_007682 [Rhodosporidiobolus microsporus]